jgi:hypothetical protein
LKQKKKAVEGILGAGVKVLVDGFETGGIDVGVDLGGGDVGVSKKLLDDA